MNKRLISVLVFAFVIATVASVILYRLISAQLTANAKVAANRVLVASHNLETGALIREGDVKVADWGGPVPSGTLAKPEDAIGRGVVEPIYEGEPIIDGRIAARGAGAGLAATIPPGMRAVAVRVNDVVGVAGFVTPGMHVDLLIAGNPPGASAAIGTQTKTLLQNIEVLSAGQNIQKDAEGKPVSVGVVNLLVNPEQAEILSLASNETRIQLVLRNPTDKEIAKTTGTAIAYLFKGGEPPPPSPAGKSPVRPVARKAAPPPPPPPLEPVKTEKVVVPITVEVIHGSTKTETKFSVGTPAKEPGTDKDQKDNPEGNKK